MLSPILWDKLDEIGRRMRGRLQVPFGGIQMIVSGDFCQLPTVSDKDFCFQSTQWNKTIRQVHYLHRVFRQRDPVFQRVLEKVRIGVVDSEVESVLTSRQQPLEKKHGIQPTVLFSRCTHATEYNQKKMDNLIKKKKSQYLSAIGIALLRLKVSVIVICFKNLSIGCFMLMILLS